MRKKGRYSAPTLHEREYDSRRKEFTFWGIGGIAGIGDWVGVVVWVDLVAAMKLSHEVLDVGNIVEQLLHPEGLDTDERDYIYTIEGVAVNFKKHGSTVIMRLVKSSHDAT